MPIVAHFESGQVFGRLKSALGGTPKSYIPKSKASINVGPEHDVVQTASRKSQFKDPNKNFFRKIVYKFSQQFKKQEATGRPITINNAAAPNVPLPMGKVPSGNVHHPSNPMQLNHGTQSKDELPSFEDHAKDPVVEFSHSHPVQYPDGTLGHSAPLSYVYNQYHGHYINNRDKVLTAQSKEDWADRFGGAKAAQETQYKNLDDIQMGEALSRSMQSKYDHKMTSSFAHSEVASDITPVSYGKPQSFIGTDRETGRAIYSDSMPIGQMNTYKQAGVDPIVPVKNGFFAHGDDVHAPAQHSNNSTNNTAKDPFDDDDASSMSSERSSRYAASSNASYAESVFDKPLLSSPREESFDAIPLPPESVKSFKTAGTDTHIPHKAGYASSTDSASERPSYASSDSSYSATTSNASSRHQAANLVDTTQAELDKKVFSFDQEIRNSEAYKRAGLGNADSSQSTKQYHPHNDDVSSFNGSFTTSNDSASWLSRD